VFQQKRFGFDWGEFITGVALIVAAVVVLRHPAATMVTLSFVFALVAIIRGIATLAAFPNLRQVTGGLSWLTLVSGIFDIILGLLFIFNIPAGVFTLAYMFAIWFVIDSIAGLANASHLRRAGTGWYVLNLILQVFGLLVGILLLMNPVVSAVSMVSLIAMAFIIFGIGAIVMAFARRDA